MATAIASLPNEVPENNVVMKVKETNQKVPNPPQQEPISVQPQNTTELSQESIHQIVQGLQQAGGATVLPNREIPINNNSIWGSIIVASTTYIGIGENYLNSNKTKS